MITEMQCSSRRRFARLAQAGLTVLLVALGPAASLNAQTDEAPRETPREAPSEAPATDPSNAHLLDSVAVEAGGDVGSMVMNFSDAPLSAVLNEMSQRLGLVIVNPPRIAERVTIISRRSLDADEAVEMLNTALKLSGYAAVRNERMLRIMTLQQAQTAGIPVRSGADPARIGNGDAMITQIIPIRYAEATKLKDDLAGLVPEYAHMTCNEASNTLIFTASESDVRHVVEIVSALDIQLSAANTVRVFRLEFADAEATAELIEDIFGGSGSGSGSSSRSRNSMREAFMRRMMRGPGGGDSGGDATGQDARVQAQKVTASHDEQTNSVVVSAPPEIMAIIAEVIEQLDGNPTAEESIFVYPLTNAKAANLETVLQDIFDENAGSSGSSSRTSRTGGRSAFQGRGFPGAGGASSSSASAAAGDLAGKVYVVADEDTNSLLVRTAPKYFDRVRAILKELDRPTRQVLIKVLIAEITHDKSLDLGAQFSVLNLNIGSGTGTVGTDFGLANLTDGLVGRFLSTDFTATLRALQELGKLEVLSRPYLMGAENQAATITVGEEVPFITNSRVTDNGQTIDTVEYQDIGIILSVTPYIGPDGMVIMDVSQEISSTTGRTVTVSGRDTEIYAKRSAETRVAVQNGRTVVIGGLIQNKEVDSVSQVPLLGSIPVLGNLFKRTIKENQKIELLIFLSPRTALTPDELDEITRSSRNDSERLRNTGDDDAFGGTIDRILDGQASGKPAPADAGDEDDNEDDPE